MDNSQLQHYASEFYDPAKAHEYYMKNRNLKGRRSASTLTDKGKEIWTYTNDNIKDKKNNNVNSAKDIRDKKIAELSAKASETRKRISNKLKELNKQLTQMTATKMTTLEEDKKSKIKQLMAESIPDNLPKEQRAKLIKERNDKIFQIQSDTKISKSKVSDESKTDRLDNGNDTSSERLQVSTDLKTAVTAAREVSL